MQTGPAAVARWAAFGFVAGQTLVYFRLFFFGCSLKTHLRSQRDGSVDEDTCNLSSVPRTHWCKKRTPSCPLHAVVHAGAQAQINYF